MKTIQMPDGSIREVKTPDLTKENEPKKQKTTKTKKQTSKD